MNRYEEASDPTHPETPSDAQPRDEAGGESSSEPAAEGAEAHPGPSDADAGLTVDPAQLEAENASLRDQLLRARAELENLRRRAERDVENAHKFAAEKFAEALLPVCDSLEMGMAAAEKGADLDKLVEGMRLTMESFRQVFTRFGITVEDPTGERFDPERHQAMSMQEHPEQAPNTVLQTLQKGYLLHGRVLRPAMVVVSRAPAPRIDESA